LYERLNIIIIFDIFGQGAFLKLYKDSIAY